MFADVNVSNASLLCNVLYSVSADDQESLIASCEILSKFYFVKFLCKSSFLLLPAEVMEDSFFTEPAVLSRLRELCFMLE